MDERVYEVEVCAECFTQVEFVRGEPENCAHCGADTTCEGRKPVRFRVARAAVLKQADPHQSLVERTLFFGCVGNAGHYYWRRGSGGYPYQERDLNSTAGRKAATPWGTTIDGGLFPAHHRYVVGEAHVFHKDGWTALAFEDPSVDRRPQSWSIYCIPAVLDGPEALLIARAAFPPIFARYTFPVVLAT